MATMSTLVLILLLSSILRVEATNDQITITQTNFWSVYFSKLWESIRNKITEVKHFFETEIPKFVEKIEEEVPKFVRTVETEIPKFVESLHLREELEQKTEAIANATTDVKRFFEDLWETKLTAAVDSLKEVFLIVVAVTVLALLVYLYLECFLLRKLAKLLIAIPKLLYELVRFIVKKVAKIGRKKPNYVHVYRDGKVYVNIV